jgi:hypothetical protein
LCTINLLGTGPVAAMVNVCDRKMYQKQKWSTQGSNFEDAQLLCILIFRDD